MYFERVKNFIFASIGNIDYDKSIGELLESSKVDFAYIALVVLAAFIATLGLITNSVAVIIGAMIISPIMSPIMLSGASFAIMDKTKAKSAVFAVIVGVAVAVMCTMLTVTVSPIKENTAEILARTTPNILDLFIAFFCGVAGALSVVSEKISKGVVGVSISVALMPPLCVGAFGLATAQTLIALGGFWMFFLNMAAIFVATFAILSLFGYSSYFEAKRQRQFGARWVVSFGILAVISIPLVISLKETIVYERDIGVIKSELKKSFNKESLSILQKDTVEKTDDGYLINASLDTVKSFNTKYIKNVENNITSALGSKVKLFVIQRGVLSLGGTSSQFGFLDVLRPKVGASIKSESEEKISKIEVLMRFADIGTWRYDKNTNMLLIESSNPDIEKLSKFQQKLSEEGILSTIYLPPQTTVFEAKTDLLKEISNIKTMMLISEFSLKNGIELDIIIPQEPKNDKKTKNILLEIFGQNNISINDDKTKKESMRIVTKESNATAK